MSNPKPKNIDQKTCPHEILYHGICIACGYTMSKEEMLKRDLTYRLSSSAIGIQAKQSVKYFL